MLRMVADGKRQLPHRVKGLFWIDACDANVRSTTAGESRLVERTHPSKKLGHAP
jgi:hypothetical protein